MLPVTPSCIDARLNRLLAALRPLDWQRLQRLLEPVDLQVGQVLCESGIPPMGMVFPTTAVMSLMYLTQEGASAEVAVVGNDGVVGLALFMGGNAMPSRAVVQSAGAGYRLRAQALRDEIGCASSLLHGLLVYTHALIAQVTQTAACNRHHAIEQQLCRRLLQGLDRSPTGELLMTQESLSALLGVRREGVTAAAHKLKLAGVIRYHRGRIVVLDRERLQRRTCECYAATQQAHQRQRPMPLAA